MHVYDPAITRVVPNYPIVLPVMNFHFLVLMYIFTFLSSILDDMIEARRKEQKKEIKRGPKKATAVERSVATGHAKREAAAKARRGLTQEKKPTKAEIEKEVNRQTQKTAAQKKKKEQKQTQGRIAPDSTGRNKAKRDRKKADPPAAQAVFGGRAPPKKAIEAAIKGMESAGFTIPAGHQMVMTFVPFAVAPAPTPKGGGKKPNQGAQGKNNNNGGTPSSKKGASGGRQKK